MENMDSKSDAANPKSQKGKSQKDKDQRPKQEGESGNWDIIESVKKMPKPNRIPPHTIQNLHDREIPLEEVERTLQQPERVSPGYDGCEVYMCRYKDTVLDQEMLLRVIVEETESE